MPCTPDSFKNSVSWIDKARIIKIHYDDEKDNNLPDDDNLLPETEPNNTVRQKPILDKGPTASLAERLANCPEELANRTLHATMQLRDSNIDMDNQ